MICPAKVRKVAETSNYYAIFFHFPTLKRHFWTASSEVWETLQNLSFRIDLYRTSSQKTNSEHETPKIPKKQKIVIYFHLLLAFENKKNQQKSRGLITKCEISQRSVLRLRVELLTASNNGDLTTRMREIGTRLNLCLVLKKTREVERHSVWNTKLLSLFHKVSAVCKSASINYW